MSKKIIIGALIIVAVVAGFFLLQRKPDREPNTLEKIKVGVVPAAYYLPIFVAKEKGFFAKNGLDAQIVFFNTTTDMLNAFLKGDLDVIAQSCGSLFPLEAISPGKFKFIYGQNNLSYSFVVRSDSNIKSLSDLKSKRIGTWPSPTAKVFVNLVLKKYFDPTKEAEIVPLDFKLLNQALEQKQVDAVFNTDIFTETGIQNKISKYLVRYPMRNEVIDPTFNGGGIVSAKLTKTNPQKVKKIKKSFEQAIDYINQDPKGARKTLLAFVSVSEKIALSAPLDEYLKVDEINTTKAQKLADILYKEKLMDKAINFSGLIYAK